MNAQADKNLAGQLEKLGEALELSPFGRDCDKKLILSVGFQTRGFNLYNKTSVEAVAQKLYDAGRIGLKIAVEAALRTAFEWNPDIAPPNVSSINAVLDGAKSQGGFVDWESAKMFDSIIKGLGGNVLGWSPGAERKKLDRQLKERYELSREELINSMLVGRERHNIKTHKDEQYLAYPATVYGQIKYFGVDESNPNFNGRALSDLNLDELRDAANTAAFLMKRQKQTREEQRQDLKTFSDQQRGVLRQPNRDSLGSVSDPSKGDGVIAEGSTSISTIAADRTAGVFSAADDSALINPSSGAVYTAKELKQLANQNISAFAALCKKNLAGVNAILLRR
jgi:hypothetical protein